jgi:hypothetical protein
MSTTDLVQALANRFGEMLLRELGADAYARVVAENRRRRSAGDCDTCASHDEMDSNEIMAAAFAEVVGREDCIESDADAVLWNSAWAEWDAAAAAIDRAMIGGAA